MAHVHERTWWKEAIVYQIYPISFFDSNGDGIGDLNGIFAKLDYLKDLGVDVLWLSPIYRSPLADMGYDIADYQNIDERYGTLDDWDNLLKGCHERGMKLVMDLVVNHSSDEHEWFLQSRSSKDDPKRDWYIWRPPKVDSAGNKVPPNNWRSVFQGSAWDYDEKTEEYYLHLYVSKQPDFNWDNLDVRKAVYDLMKFWLDRGCDGFRMDVINLISKVDGLPDAPISAPGESYQPASMYYANGPRVHEYIREMEDEVLSKYDIMTVGETPFTHDAEELAAYVLPANKELNMVFQFELMDIDSPMEGPQRVPLIKKEWKLEELREITVRWQLYKRDEGFWNAIFIENHDHSRAVSRYGNDSPQWRSLSAKMLAILEVTQGGTLYVYQGQELGLQNFPRSWGIEEYKDVASQNYWHRILKQRQRESGKEDVDMSDVLDGFSQKARDHARVPMQWDKSSNAGFTTGTPWMRVNEDYETWNVSSQLQNLSSVLSFYKSALKLRKTHPIFTYGDFVDLSGNHPQVFAYLRTLDGAQALVVLNFKETPVAFQLVDVEGLDQYRLALANYDENAGPGGGRLAADGKIIMRGYEGHIYLRS
ncbi:glycoside hydrolase family 13 protein [Macrolepiota fuliginosa MF-IS2]|uniref:Glycoside hydrolase family 13 protein n=1 Tax=Macrolepiota fuliginosa MF-IS2 TaxID=1400762 RepID=A0A9P5XEP5_9AGAR|nr:glycoside hydrolase family 13 protein [Macrolepiota fuliginosa MF-IS2]